jgi:hypothetical protein
MLCSRQQKPANPKQAYISAFRLFGTIQTAADNFPVQVLPKPFLGHFAIYLTAKFKNQLRRLAHHGEHLRQPTNQ